MRMKSLVSAVGFLFAIALLVLGMGTVIDDSITGAALSGTIGEFFGVLPQMLAFVVIPIVGVGVIGVWVASHK